MTANGGQRAGQGKPAVFEDDQCARGVGAPGEHSFDRDTEHPFGLGWVAVKRVPEADGQVRPAIHVRSHPLGRAGCARDELIEELL